MRGSRAASPATHSASDRAARVRIAFDEHHPFHRHLGRGALIILEVEAAIERRFRLDPRIIEPLDIPEMGVGIDDAHRRVSLHQRHQADQPPSIIRSEEHTSELQSLMRISYAVFCLKKKNTATKKKINELNPPKKKLNTSK